MLLCALIVKSCKNRMDLVTRQCDPPLIGPLSGDGVLDRDYAILTDIMGLEDFLGDMDFKLAGTETGITALQADTKLPGLPLGVVEGALAQGHTGIRTIIDTMDTCISRVWPHTQKKVFLVFTSRVAASSQRGSNGWGGGGLDILVLFYICAGQA